MGLGHVLSWIMCGLVVGMCARFLVPGRQRMGLILTAVLGIMGACAGGFLYWTLNGQPGVAFSLSGNAWHGWLYSIIGAVLVLWGFTIVVPSTKWRH